MCAASDDIEELRRYVDAEMLNRISTDLKMTTHIGQIIDELQKLKERVDILEKRGIN